MKRLITASRYDQWLELPYLEQDAFEESFRETEQKYNFTIESTDEEIIYDEHNIDEFVGDSGYTLFTTDEMVEFFDNYIFNNYSDLKIGNYEVTAECAAEYRLNGSIQDGFELDRDNIRGPYMISFEMEEI